MSDSSDYPSPVATEAPMDLTGEEFSGTEFDQQSIPPWAQPPSSASLSGEPSVLSPSNGFVDGNFDTPSTWPSDFDPHFAPEHSLMSGGPSTSSRQPLQSSTRESATTDSQQSSWVNDESQELFPRIGPSPSEAPQQEPSSFDAVMDDIMREPLSMDDDGPVDLPDIDPSVNLNVLKGAQQVIDEIQTAGFGKY